MMKQYMQALTPKRTCRNYIVASNSGGTWSGVRCDNNQPVSGSVPAGGSIQTGCIVEGSLVLNNATNPYSSECAAPTGNVVIVGYTDQVAPGNACATTTQVWVASPDTDIAPGVQVYVSPYLTLKLLNKTYIKKQSNGEIFNISNDGIVGASTGLFC